jgi:hypothetical protein
MIFNPTMDALIRCGNGCRIRSAAFASPKLISCPVAACYECWVVLTETNLVSRTYSRSMTPRISEAVGYVLGRFL